MINFGSNKRYTFNKVCSFSQFCFIKFQTHKVPLESQNYSIKNIPISLNRYVPFVPRTSVCPENLENEFSKMLSKPYSLFLNIQQLKRETHIRRSSITCFLEDLKCQDLDRISTAMSFKLLKTPHTNSIDRNTKQKALY